MNAVKLVAVFAENKPGQTARITKILADADVNIRWVTIANSGTLRRHEVPGGTMPTLAYQALKQQGFMASLRRGAGRRSAGQARRAARRGRLPGPAQHQPGQRLRLRRQQPRHPGHRGPRTRPRREPSCNRKASAC